MRLWLRRRRMSLVLAALTLVLALATGSVLRGPRPPIRSFVGTGLTSIAVHHNYLSLVTSVLFTNNVVELVIVIVALVLLVGRAEQLLGAWRTLLAYLATAVVGIAVGVGLQAAGFLTRALFTAPPSDMIVLDPSTPIVGTVFAASAFAGPLWRRRIRVLGMSSLVVLLLYTGQPDDFYRLAAGAAGLVLGELLAPRTSRPIWPRSSHHESRSLIGALVAVSALGPFLAVISPRGYGLLRPLGVLFRVTRTPSALSATCGAKESPIECVRDLAFVRLNDLGAIVLSPLPLLVLVVAAFGIWHGRRVAAWSAIGVNLFLAVLAAVYYGFLPTLLDHDQIVLPGAFHGLTLQTALAVAVPLGVAIVVGANLRHFEVLPSRAAVRLTIGAPALTLIVTAVLYVGGGWLVRGQFAPRVTLLDLLADLPERYVPVGFLHLRRLDFVPHGQVAHLLYDWAGAVFWAVLLLSVASGSLAARGIAPAADVARVRALLRQGTVGSLSYMATWTGVRYWFTGDGSHAVAYRESSGVAITIGEPIGPEAGGADAARRFAVYCDDIGLTPVFYAVRRGLADGLRPGLAPDAGWPVAGIGEDTVLHPATFRMTGKRWQDVRSSINRADRQGLAAVWTDWETLSRGNRAQIQSISEEWIAERQLPELGFTIGGVQQLRDREVKLMLAIDADGRIQAVTSWLPSYRDGVVRGWTLDFMRRRSGSMNGVMEFLIATVATQSQERGLEFVSLSVAPLATTVPDDEANRLERLLATISRILEPAYGFKSLATFKEKFQPELEPLVIAYPDAIALPAISVALARIYLPGLSLPKILRLAGTLRPEAAPASAAPAAAAPAAATPVPAAVPAAVPTDQEIPPRAASDRPKQG